jgi:hypothetical protein
VPSPFPGMDPYLESPAFWQGFHTRFLVEIGNELVACLPPGYYADVEQTVWLHDFLEDGPTQAIRPDAYVAGERSNTATAVLTVNPPSASIQMHPPTLEDRQRYIEIVDQADQRVVTAIELLSPSNKDPGSNREHYLRKRNSYFQSQTNLVEIDLLRSGQRMPSATPIPMADYLTIIVRADQFPQADVWARSLQEPLPIIPVPLKPGDGTVPLDLQACLCHVYDQAGYRNRIRYDRPPTIPLAPTDGEWAAQLFSPPR